MIREIEPGELLMLDGTGWRTYRSQSAGRKALCSFEHVYFARPDSCAGGGNAYLVRKAIGRELAKKVPICADLVIGAPDSGVAPALGFAEEAGLPFGDWCDQKPLCGADLHSAHPGRQELGSSDQAEPCGGCSEGKRRRSSR